MKCNIAARTLLIVFVAVFFVSMAATVQAKGKDPQCTIAGVAGDYGFTTTGTVVGLGPVAAVGRITFKADGDVTGSQTRSLNGSVAGETITGTFTVNPDCRGKLSANVYQSEVLVRTATLDLVYVDNEREIQAIFTSSVLQPSGTSLFTILTVDTKKLFTETDNQQ